MKKTTVLGILASTIFVVSIGGCSSYSPVWTKPDLDTKEFKKDQDECMKKSSRHEEDDFTSPESGASMRSEDLFNACMDARGYHLEERRKQ